jgi:hypothetical protein
MKNLILALLIASFVLLLSTVGQAIVVLILQFLVDFPELSEWVGKSTNIRTFGMGVHRRQRLTV